MPKPQPIALKPAAIVIFGLTGDLAQRKLIPSLYHLVKNGILHPRSVIMGVSRRPVTAEEVLNVERLCAGEPEGKCDPAALKQLQSMLRMHQMDLLDGASYDNLGKVLDDLDAEADEPLTRLFYLSIPPNVYRPIVGLLGERGLHAKDARLLVEKPFGYDLVSARELIAETGEYFAEEQIFRIDHYLAKETVQNILAFRDNNPIFEPLWSNKYIDRVEVMAAESIGIEGRALFYEQTGALRDLVQSHLLQLLAVTTMERPADMTADAIHAARLQLLESITPITTATVATQAVRGQYIGYRDEVSNPKAITDTFAALKLSIDNDRWRGVPIIVKTGKALAAKETKVRIFFRNPKDPTEPCNCLVFAIQPREGIHIDLQVKQPGFDDALDTAPMEFLYEQQFERYGNPDAYERVLVDAIRGDRTLFATSNEVLAAWKVLDAVVTTWGMGDEGLQLYERGSNGPELPADF